jgi:hypothetical protein
LPAKEILRRPVQAIPAHRACDFVCVKSFGQAELAFDLSSEFIGEPKTFFRLK